MPRKSARKPVLTRLRWNADTGSEVAREDVDAFLDEILSVCKKHGLGIAHEDRHGTFIIVPYSKGMVEWFGNAQVSDQVV